MKKVTIKAPEPKPDIEKARRVFRAAVEIIRRHDEIIKQKRAYRDVFLPEAIMLRDRLQEYCEKLMFYCPGDYGRKAEEILWRKVFYEIIQLMKCNKKHVTPSSSLESAYRTHLTSALGYYHHLLCRLQSEYDLNLEGIVDFYYLLESKAHRKSSVLLKADILSEEVRCWVIEACHRCLIYLGDLARYQHDYDGMPSKVLAQRYYYQALSLCPDDGMPNNQLGTLSGSSYYGLDAAYYYIRCIVCPKPFDGAHSNLVRLFEKNRKRITELNQSDSSLEGLLPEQQRSRDIKRFVCRFLQLLDIFYTKSRSLDAKGIQDVCQNALHDFNLCMFSQSSHPVADFGDEKPCHLDDAMVFKIFVICLAMIHIMQREGNKQVAAAIAFSLALFSHALNHTMMRLQAALYELENPPRKFTSITPETVAMTVEEVSSCAEADESQENCSTSLSKRKNSVRNKKHHNKHLLVKFNGKEDEEKKKVKSSKLRRMRRRKGSESSSGSEGNLASSNNNSDLDELKDAAESDESEAENCTLSSSDSDDNLMVSQELKPGFSSVSPEGMDNSDEQTDSERHLDLAMDVLGGTIVESTTVNQNLLNKPSTPVESVVPRKQSIADMTEYLQDISLDWLSDAANLLHQTLQFTYSAADSNGHDGADQDISAIIQGTKQVRVPPATVAYAPTNEASYDVKESLCGQVDDAMSLAKEAFWLSF